MEPSSFQTARPPAALTATPRFDDGALAPQLMPATIRRPAMMETHPTASQSAERTTPPLRGRDFAAAPTANTARVNTSIRPCDRARSTAGLPLPLRRSVLSLIALARLRFARSQIVCVRIAR